MIELLYRGDLTYEFVKVTENKFNGTQIENIILTKEQIDNIEKILNQIIKIKNK